MNGPTGTWIEVDAPGPVWLRRAFVEDGSLAVFLPGPATGQPENVVLLCAGFDGATFIERDGHLYFGSDWLKREWPGNRTIIEKIERRCLQLVAGGGDTFGG